MSGQPTIIVLGDPAALTRAVAERFEEVVRAAGHEPVSIALSGGSTPKRLYETLAASPFRERIPWRRVEIFFGDERAVPPDHADSNWGMAKSALFDHVPARAHRMAADTGDAEAYERLVRERVRERQDGVPVLDLVLLGMGGDGHTASLFPGTEALKERARLVMMNPVPKLDTRRMTFTYPLINAARRVWIVVSGADKRPVLSKCLRGEGDYPDLPILGVDPRGGELVWWLDEAAAP
ncbi:MAG: 6-phosphogluconolactonase [Candidatus Binatia bacterium]